MNPLQLVADPSNSLFNIGFDGGFSSPIAFLVSCSFFITNRDVL